MDHDKCETTCECSKVSFRLEQTKVSGILWWSHGAARYWNLRQRLTRSPITEPASQLVNRSVSPSTSQKRHKVCPSTSQSVETHQRDVLLKRAGHALGTIALPNAHLVSFLITTNTCPQINPWYHALGTVSGVFNPVHAATSRDPSNV